MNPSHPQHMITSDVIDVPTPETLAKSHPLSREASETVVTAREEIIRIMEGQDERVIAIVGPCSEDDSLQPDGTPSVVAFAQKLKAIAKRPEIAKNLLVIMRCPPIKPRSDLGLAGLEQRDLAKAHELLTHIANLHMPLAIEVMGAEHIARYGELLGLAWIGARNNTDTRLRQTLSAYNQLPILCKNGEHGNLAPALAAIKTINGAHEKVTIVLPDDRTVQVPTGGNPHTGVIWRGGTEYMSPEGFEQGVRETAQAGLPYAVDCAHANEQAHDVNHQKGVQAEIDCFNHLLDMMQKGDLAAAPKAIMVEANLLEGSDSSQKTPGKSWTDPCVSIDQLDGMLTRLASQCGQRLKQN